MKCTSVQSFMTGLLAYWGELVGKSCLWVLWVVCSWCYLSSVCKRGNVKVRRKGCSWGQTSREKVKWRSIASCCCCWQSLLQKRQTEKTAFTTVSRPAQQPPAVCSFPFSHVSGLMLLTALKKMTLSWQTKQGFLKLSYERMRGIKWERRMIEERQQELKLEPLGGRGEMWTCRAPLGPWLSESGHQYIGSRGEFRFKSG